MPTFREYRIILPLELEEFRIAQLYMIAKFSAKESGGDEGDGVEVLKNEPYESPEGKGQFTHKIYHFATKLPSWVAAMIPKKALMLEEQAWNAYPYCKTVLSSPYFTKFKLALESMHVDKDRANVENVLKLDHDTLKKRIIEPIDIGQDEVEHYVKEEDPSKFHSQKTGRGPLQPGWSKTCEPVMTAYKLVTVDVPYWTYLGFGPRLEKYISKTVERRLFTEAGRKAFCWIDEWYGLTMADIRRMEQEIFAKLNKERQARKQTNGAEDGDDVLKAIKDAGGEKGSAAAMHA